MVALYALAKGGPTDGNLMPTRRRTVRLELLQPTLRSGALARNPTVIGRPPAGRNVTRSMGHTTWPGARDRLNLFMIAASTRVASCSAKAEPMQVRGPAPNGR